MSDNPILIYDEDEDEFMYQKSDESDTDYKARMAKLHERLMAQATDQEKQLAEKVLISLVAEPKIAYK